MAKRKITKRTVDSLKPGELVWDTVVRGFGVRRQREARVYLVKYRFGNRQRWYRIGPHGAPWTVEKARGKAKAILGDVADRVDPAALRDAERNRDTVAELCDEMTMGVSRFTFRSFSEIAGNPRITFHIRHLGEVQIASVGLRLTSERGLEIVVGLGTL